MERWALRSTADLYNIRKSSTHIREPDTYDEFERLVKEHGLLGRIEEVQEESEDEFHEEEAPRFETVAGLLGSLIPGKGKAREKQRECESSSEEEFIVRRGAIREPLAANYSDDEVPIYRAKRKRM
jgi:hypothetical protein